MPKAVGSTIRELVRDCRNFVSGWRTRSEIRLPPRHRATARADGQSVVDGVSARRCRRGARNRVDDPRRVDRARRSAVVSRSGMSFHRSVVAAVVRSQHAARRLGDRGQERGESVLEASSRSLRRRRRCARMRRACAPSAIGACAIALRRRYGALDPSRDLDAREPARSLVAALLVGRASACAGRVFIRSENRVASDAEPITPIGRS